VKPYDVALGPGPNGKALAHRPDCPQLRFQAEVLLEEVITMFGVEKPLPADIARHDCLAEAKR
jgi:hypothetical protein